MKRFRLSGVVKPDWTLLRDGEFASLGLATADPGLPILTFAGAPKYLKQALKNPQVSCVLVPPELAESELIRNSEKGFCIAPELRISFFQLHNELAEPPYRDIYCEEIRPTEIGSDCDISPLADIAKNDVVIGSGVTIEPFVSIKSGTVIGNGSIIRSGSVLGGSGLEFIRMGERGILPVTHCGKLILGEKVEVQYNCNLSRSLFPWHATEIGNESKIESLVHIAHGVHTGQRCLIAASVCVAGSAILGDDVWIGPNATVSSEVKIGNNARVSLGAVVVGNVADSETVSGNFAIPHERFMQEMMKKIMDM